MEHKNILSAFAWTGDPIHTERYGHGHINITYVVSCDSGRMYILQKINKSIFKNPEQLMANIAAICDYLAERTQDPRASMKLVKTVDGKNFYVDEGQNYWRAFEFVQNSICLQSPTSPEDFRQSAIAFGKFQKMLSDFPASTLFETIPQFHNTKDRYRQFHEALEKDAAGRAALCKAEIDFYLAREHQAGTIVDRLSDGTLPLRVTHNDTKLNNVMLDFNTHEALCVIDLDTVMPGSSLYDYGDSIRFGASTAAEDEQDLSKVSMSLELFKTYTEGFLSACGDSLTPLEIEMLPIGAKMMTLECGLRFLTDYLNGDIYFRTTRDGQNLDRSRTQLTLVADMESKMEKMHQIVKEVAANLPVKF